MDRSSGAFDDGFRDEPDFDDGYDEYDEEDREPCGDPWPLRLALIGFGLSLVLAVLHARARIGLGFGPLCVDGSGCARLANLPIARPFGVSLGALGLSFYAGLVPLLMRVREIGAPAAELKVLRVGLGLACLIDLGLAVVMISERTACLLCIATWIINVELLRRVWYAKPEPEDEDSRRRLILALAASVAITGAARFTEGQLTDKDSTHLADQILAAPVVELGHRGTPIFERTGPGIDIVVAHDWTCPSCELLHETLLDFEKRRPGRISLRLLHAFPWTEGPLSRRRSGPRVQGALAFRIAASAGKAREFFELARPKDKRSVITLCTLLGLDPLTLGGGPRTDQELKVLEAERKACAEAEVKTLPMLWVNGHPIAGAPSVATLRALLDKASREP